MRPFFTLFAFLVSVGRLSALSFDYTFTVTPGGPAETVVGSFSGTFEPGPGLDISAASEVTLKITGFTYTIVNTLLEVSDATAAGTGRFKLGGEFGGINRLTPGTNDFLVYFEDRGTLGVSPITFGYTSTASSDFFNTPTFSVLRTAAVGNPVAERGNAALLFGPAMLGFIALRKSRAGVAARSGCRRRCPAGEVR